MIFSNLDDQMGNARNHDWSAARTVYHDQLIKPVSLRHRSRVKLLGMLGLYTSMGQSMSGLIHGIYGTDPERKSTLTNRTPTPNLIAPATRSNEGNRMVYVVPLETLALNMAFCCVAVDWVTSLAVQRGAPPEHR